MTLLDPKPHAMNPTKRARKVIRKPNNREDDRVIVLGISLLEVLVALAIVEVVVDEVVKLKAEPTNVADAEGIVAGRTSSRGNH